MSGAPWWGFRADPGHSAGSADDRADTVTRTARPAPPVVTSPPRPLHGLHGLHLTAAVLAAVLLVLLGLLAARTIGSSGGAVTGAATANGPGTTVVASGAVPAAGGAAAGGTAAADAAATAELEALRRQGLEAHPVAGQWVAQLAAKSVGTTDPVQTAANGSSTFYATDILAQSRQIASGVAGGDVFVLRTTDFGEGLLDARGNPYWVTLAAGPFADADDVHAWCDSMFATTPAQERGNVCLPKQLTPRA
ncbi:hypothetical protein [Kineococcus sp. SYSU DK003]|uniref:hypothetical protein n=1 Tax=Kineococcus sp. SYSU DK003 TaxID=3383124 RepID=UPI003D7ED1F4